MHSCLKSIKGSVNAPKGFLSAGAHCGIKPAGLGKGSSAKNDIAVIVSEAPAAVAGMFTTNQVCAAPVKVSEPRASKATAQAIVVNSGNANACTGERGLKDARAMCALVGKALNLPEEDVLVCSTGRIGIALPMTKVKAGIADCLGGLNATAKNARETAVAIMTSDKVSKEVAVEFKLDGTKVRIGGIAKGAGMIEPGMSPNGQRPASTSLHATMLSFITTDAAIAPKTLKAALKEAVAQSFNRVTVDGDMSTNDSVIALANGMAGNKRIGPSNKPAWETFQTALNHVCLELAKMMARDGEGATRLITIRLRGAANAKDADTAARTVANSQLVRTSWCGGDPNWGRILDSLGYSAAKVVEEKIDVGYSLPGDKRITYSLKKGRPTKTTLAELGRIAKRKEFDLHINLNLGRGAALIYSADLSEEYVTFNRGE